jgi:hypothetical protein
VQNLNSITQINKRFTTGGSEPVLVLANDYNSYVCKYQRAANSAGLLINEFLGSSILGLWGIETPSTAFVTVKSDHINMVGLNLQPQWFTIPCFGSKFNKYYDEVDAFLEVGTRSNNKGLRFDDLFLKIALFDLFLSNEDRNGGNYNLLVDTTQNNKIIPIDHAAIFNTNSLKRGIFSLSFEDSLLSSPLLMAIYSVKQLQEQKRLQNLKTYYYLCIAACKVNLSTIVNILPDEWCPNKEEFLSDLEEKLLNDKWIDDTWQVFLEHIQLATNQ